MAVVPLFVRQETVEEFVRREGVVNTAGVEARFGFSNREARAALQRLADSGKIIKDGRRFPVDWGSVCQWRAK